MFWSLYNPNEYRLSLLYQAWYREGAKHDPPSSFPAVSAPWRAPNFRVAWDLPGSWTRSLPLMDAGGITSWGLCHCLLIPALLLGEMSLVPVPAGVAVAEGPRWKQISQDKLV